jgi:site-specific DNA recombinase
MTQRVALYARYSTDKQRETSIDDQLRQARGRAEREGWEIVTQHADEGTSGSVPVALRKGGKALLADALAGRFDVLIVEGLDRLSREVGEQETITKRLEYRGVRIIGTSDGYDSQGKGKKVMRIARGLVNELYLDDLREKTHRGLAGQFDRGFHVGGVCYGYRSEPTPDGKGRCLVIDDTQAATVRQVFELFADGHSTRAIAHRLNAQGVASPRGGTWAVSALYGDTKRGAGMLNNEQYAGRQVWNRRQWLKDPETGKRRYVDRPQAEWQVRETPELRIVSPELWARVRNRQRTGPKTGGTRSGRGAAPRSLFSGLLRCSTCGGPMVAVDRYRYGCNINQDRGATVCPNPLRVKREAVERRLLAVLRDELFSGEALAELQAEVRQLLAAQARDARDDSGEHQRRLVALQAEIARLVDAVAAVGISTALAARLQAAEAEQADTQRQMDNITQRATAPAELLDDVMARYRRLVLNLGQVLEEDEDRTRVRQMLAELLGPVVIGADEDGKPWAEIEETTERLIQAVGGSMGLVAGARFELATFGL